MKRSIRNYNGTYRLAVGMKLCDSGDVYPHHDADCALCRSHQKHSVWSHWALTVGEVQEAAIDHTVWTVL